jgi:hypothetical protein
MALTTQQFQQWLEDPAAVRCLLLETSANIAGIETSIFLSNRNYVTSPTSSPANTAYLPVLKTSVKFTETLSLDEGSSLSYGDISIDNTTGEYDHWLQAAWQGRTIRILIGDPKFQRDDFTVIFSGVVGDINSSDRYTLNLQLRDKLETLNTPITEVTLGNYFQGNIVSPLIYDNPNKEQVLPLVFGEVFNITPLLMDPSTLEFMVHRGPIERIIEIRDNGVPLQAGSGYTVDLSRGTFKLLNNPAGTITCSVQGDKTGTYRTTVAEIIKHIVKTYGNPAVMGNITDADLDLANFAAFDAAHPQAVGIFITGKDNVLNVCQELASSLGAQLIATRLGKLQLLKVDVPVVTATRITDQDILYDSLAVSQKPPVVAAYKLGYCKNWTVQNNLLTGIPSEHKDLLSGEWLSATQTNQNAKTLYKLNTLPEQKDTLLLTESLGQVTAEAARLVTLYSTQRYVYRFTCTAKHLQIPLGSMIVLQHGRFGLGNGKAAQIVSTEIDWDTGFVTFEGLV